MSPEQQIQQTRRRIHHTDAMLGEAVQLDAIAVRLMALQRCWNAPERPAHLAVALNDCRAAWQDIQDALAGGALALPPDIQHNLLILSVYAESKIGACEAAPSAEKLGGLIALTRTLAGSLKEWREAA